MTATELFKEGRLAEAILAQNSEVKRQPADQDARYLLFMLLCFAGELERAEKQLDVLGRQDEKAQMGGLLYRSLLGAELERRKVFEQGARPVLPPDPPGYLEERLRGLESLRAGDLEGLEKSIDRAVDESPILSGKLNGRDFEGLRDYDDLLGTVVEIFAGGRYLWMPLDRLRRLEIGGPATALDTLWHPAKLEDADGEEADIHLPVLYAGSHAYENEAVQLGRVTEWVGRGEYYTGAGQHIFLVSHEGEVSEEPVLGIRKLELGGTG